MCLRAPPALATGMNSKDTNERNNANTYSIGALDSYEVVLGSHSLSTTDPGKISMPLCRKKLPCFRSTIAAAHRGCASARAMARLNQ